MLCLKHTSLDQLDEGNQGVVCISAHIFFSVRHEVLTLCYSVCKFIWNLIQLLVHVWVCESSVRTIFLVVSDLWLTFVWCAMPTIFFLLYSFVGKTYFYLWFSLLPQISVVMCEMFHSLAAPMDWWLPVNYSNVNCYLDWGWKILKGTFTVFVVLRLL